MSTRRARIRQAKGGRDLKVGVHGPHAFGIVCNICDRLQVDGVDIVVLHGKKICISCASAVSDAVNSRKVQKS